MTKRWAAACLLAAASCGGDPVLPPAVGEVPTGFLWGTAIAPYQVEGGLHADDWYAWETACSICSGDSADDGPDFWNRWADDLDAAVAMKNNSIRLGIEWSRIFPTAASFPLAPDPDAVARYHQMLAGARARGLEPMVTLHHFATPIWITGAWEHADIGDLFEAWSRWAAAEYGAEVDWWVTINEPMALVAGGYLGGMFPPGRTLDTAGAVKVLDAMIPAHARAYDAIHATDLVDADGDGEAAWVSIASHNRVWTPKDPANPADVLAAQLLDYVNNTLFFEALVRGRWDRNWDLDFDDPGESDLTDLAGRMDYVGLNYYGTSLVIGTGTSMRPFVGLTFMNDLDRQGLDVAITDIGWAIFPAGLRTVLDQVAAFGLPILITENGLSDASDGQRPRFLVEHLYEVARAIDDGVDIRGYYHWSLVDNFEWAYGYCPRFGLYELDLDDPARPRKPRPSASVYRRIIEANTVRPSLFAEFPTYPPAADPCPRHGF